jgi:DnaJ domain
MNDNDDPYIILGVSNDASDDDIKKAYRKLALKYHPDRYSGSTVDEQKKAADTFAKISAANEILSDTEERWQYDMRKKNGGKAGIRYVRPTSNGNYDTTFYENNNNSNNDFNWTTPSYTKTYTTPSNDPTSCCSGTKTRETLGPYKVTKTTIDANGVPQTTTYYTSEPPQDSPTKLKRTVNVTKTMPSPTGKTTTKTKSTKTSTPTSPYKITRTTYDSNGIPTTTTFYSDQPPSDSKTPSTTVGETTKSKVKSCPNPISTATSNTISSSPYKVTKTIYDENGVPTTSTFITNTPPPDGKKKIVTSRIVNSPICSNASPVYTQSPSKIKVVSSCPMKQEQQQTLTSSSSKIIQNKDGSTDVITTTITKLSDGTITHQSNSTQRFPPGVTPVLNSVGGSSKDGVPLSIKTNMSNVSSSPMKNGIRALSLSPTKKKVLK